MDSFMIETEHGPVVAKRVEGGWIAEGISTIPVSRETLEECVANWAANPY